MNKLTLSVLFLLFTTTAVFAQKKETDTPDESDQKDIPTSYFKFGVGIGNQLLSIHNKALNASENINSLIFSPSIGYFHKSGFGISFQGYLLKDSGSTNFYQSSLTPSYEYDGDDVGFGISYSRYFVKNKYGGATSPIQNDIYTSILFKKPWLQPGIAAGYASGTYKEINIQTLNLPQFGTVTFPDTATTKTKAFSLIGSLQHTFEFANVLTEGGDLSFTPTILANAGAAKFVVTHANRFSANVANTRGRGRVRGGTGTGTGESSASSFTLESVGANFALLYSIGKFSLEPQVYLDYYLQNTDTKKFTQVYNISLSVVF